jgi:hypothetical protein
MNRFYNMVRARQIRLHSPNMRIRFRDNLVMMVIMAVVSMVIVLMS